MTVDKFMMLWVWLTALFSVVVWVLDYKKDRLKGVTRYPNSAYIYGFFIFWIVLGWVPYWIMQ